MSMEDANPGGARGRSGGTVEGRTGLRLAHKLTAALLLLSVVPLAVAGTIAYGQLRTVIHAETQRTLRVAADGARATVREFLEYLKGRTLDVSTDWFIRDSVERLAAGPGSAEALAELGQYLAVSRTVVPETTEVFLLDPRGRVLASSDPSAIGQRNGETDYFRNGRTGVYVSDFFRTPDGRQVSWVVAAPLTGRHSGAFLGVVALRIDPRALSDITTGRKVTAFGAQSQSMRLGRSGEVYIVNRQGLMLTESRFLPDVILRQAVDTEPVRRAFRRGAEMLGDYRDYRGVPNTGASAIVAEQGWLIVAEVDFDEAFTPVRRLRTAMLGLGAVVLPAVALLGLVLRRSIVQPMRAMLQANERVVREGPLAGLIAAEEIPNDEWRLVMSMRNRMLRRVEEQSTRLYEESERRRREVEVLVDLAQRINASTPVDGILARVAEGARELCRGDLAAVALPDGEADALTVAFVAGEGVAAGARAHLAGGRLVVAGARCCPDGGAGEPSASGGADLAVPIRIGLRTEGAISVHAHSRHDFTEHDEAILVSLANQAGIAIQGARLTRDHRTRQRRLESLLELSRGLSRIASERPLRRRIAEAAGKLVDTDCVALHVPEAGALVRVGVAGPDGEALPARVQAQEDAIGTVATTGETVRFADLDSAPGLLPGTRDALKLLGYRALLVVPLGLGESVVGILSLATGRPAGFSADDVMLATTFAGHAATALDNARLYREAQEADRRKDEFLAMLAHELRNPLAPILNAARVLDRLGPQDRDAARLRGIISRQAGRLARLVDDLLDVARISYGKIGLSRQPVDLNEVARRAFESLHDAGRAEEHDIALVTAPDPVVVEGDPVRLEQVVGNLLENAVKYTPAGGAIQVVVERTGPRALVRVRDHGVGIAPEMLARVFEPLTQADRSLDRAQGGLGLGLALVRALVELHHGTARADSAGPGQGSEFVVELPLRGGVLEAGPDKPRGPEPGPCHVLIVEDNADAREALGALLALGGHRVELAPDGVAGLDAALASRPDVALVDLGLPGLDGYELARRVRAAGARGMRLIALTGYGQPDDVRRARDAGFDVHLTKPVDPDELAAVIARLLAA